MSVEAQISQAGLAADTDIFSVLSAMEQPTSKPAIKAKWAPIRISPDLATGEVLNVGVCVLHRKKVHIRILPNAAPFEALYGKAGKENFSFLLNMIGRYFHEQPKLLIEISPHVSLGQVGFVAGDSIEEILGRLYTSMVSLDLMCQKKEDTKSRNISTETLRQHVYRFLKKENRNFTEQKWHDESSPIIIPSGLQGRDTIRLQHLQLWSEPNLTNDKIRFASFVSADYIKASAGDMHLLYAKQDIELAANHKEGVAKEAGLFIYRPDTLPSDVGRNVDNTIDHTYWLLNRNIEQKAAFRMEVEDDISKLTLYAQEFAA